MTVFYVDVSEHDRNRRGSPLGWSQIKGATSSCMIARATYGDPDGVHFSTNYFAEMQAGAKVAGFDLRGGYHNLVRGNATSVARQVDRFRKVLDSQGCNWAMLDVERFEELTSIGAEPDINTVRRWYDRWTKVDDRVCALYLPHWVWDGHMGRPDLSSIPGPLVASIYPTGSSRGYAAVGGDGGPGWAGYGGKSVDIWQFTSTFAIPGASGDTDVNAVKGTYDHLRSLLTGEKEDTSVASIDDVYERVDFLYDKALSGGSSCGVKVDAGGGKTGNSDIQKMDYLLGQQAAVVSGLNAITAKLADVTARLDRIEAAVTALSVSGTGSVDVAAVVAGVENAESIRAVASDVDAIASALRSAGSALTAV